MLRTLTPPAVAEPTEAAPDREPLGDRLASWTLRRALAPALVALILAQLACWAPHYLTWPWWSDHDVFATMALGWERGLLPYRDLLSNNFPGTIYLFWLVGRLAGWGRTWPFLALDVALVAALGLGLVAWSRRRFGHALPGLVGFAAWLGFYLSLDYTQTAQRDGQGPALALLALLTADARRGRPGLIASAALAAFGFAIRPQTALLWPAIALAIHASRVACSRPSRVPALASWLAWLAAGLALAFAPLALAGVLDDFLAGVRGGALGGSYFRLTPGSFAAEFLRQITMTDLVAVAAILLLRPQAPAATRRSALVALAALAGVLLYRPLSPTPHAYLDQPHRLVLALNLAALTALVLDAGPIRLPASFRLAALLAVLSLGAAFRPEFANPIMAARAASVLRSGHDPDIGPMGYRENREVALAARYAWPDLRDTLDYLRAHTGPQTRVANALQGVPALTGPAARLPAFPAESIAWLAVRPEDEPAFAESLDAAGPDSVVVWSPSEIGHDHRRNRDFHLPAIEPVIRRHYRPEAAFGPIEVWRRRPHPGRP